LRKLLLREIRHEVILVSCLRSLCVSTTPPPQRRRRFRLGATLTAGFLICVAHAHASQTLRVGTSGDYPPFSRAENEGEFRGLDVELAQRLGEELGMQVELVRFKWPELMSELRKGSFDIVMSGVTMRPERAIDGRYARPYAMTGAVALIRKADAGRFQNAESLNTGGRTVVVNAGGHLERVARRFFPRASIRTVPDNLSLPALVRSGEADAAVSDSAEATVVAGHDLSILGPFTSDYKAFLLPSANAALARRVDEWLARRERDGWLGQLRETWLATHDPPGHRAASRHAVVAMVGLRLRLMPFVAAAKRAAEKPVEDAIQEERVLARVREQSHSAPEWIEGVYRLLIRMAKEVQQNTPPADVLIPLSSLRDAIVRIDEQLVRELDRLPASRDTDWTPLLAAQFSELSIDRALQAQLASALSSGIGSHR
jgi:cyclohexadienyl dehydratase